jgi:hypothetical protein
MARVEAPARTPAVHPTQRFTLAHPNAPFATDPGRLPRHYRTAEDDPEPTFMTSPADGGVGWEADILMGLPHVLRGCSTVGGGAVKNSRLPHNRKEI